MHITKRRGKREKQRNSQLNNWYVLIAGLVLFLLTTSIDLEVAELFKNSNVYFLDLLFSLISNFFVMVIVLYAIPSIILYSKKAKNVVILWMVFIVSSILSILLKALFSTQRPDLTISNQFFDVLDHSFPSMHSIVGFAALPLLVSFLKNPKFFVIFGFFIAVSRVYLRFHYLSDVVFGMLFGYFIGFIVVKLLAKTDAFALQKRRFWQKK